MKSIKDVSSLLSTLEFLEQSGAGEPLSESPTVKSTLEILSAKKLFPRGEGTLTSPALAEKSLPQLTTSNRDSVISKVSEALAVPRRSVVPHLKKNQTYMDEAQQLAASAQTLEALKEALSSFEGCALKHTATTTVFADGNPQADIMLVGEAPGADEDRQGLPFVGGSGQLLDKMLHAIGKKRQEDYYVANVIPWRPPGNRPPTREETLMCLPFIKRHIELKNPKVLIFIGATAAKSLLNTKEGMSKLRGKWFDYEGEGRTIASTVLFHPSYLIRSPGQKKHAWIDLLTIKKGLLERS